MQWIMQEYNTEKYGSPSWKSLLKAVSRVDETLFDRLAKEHQLEGECACDYSKNKMHGLWLMVCRSMQKLNFYVLHPFLKTAPKYVAFHDKTNHIALTTDF